MSSRVWPCPARARVIVYHSSTLIQLARLGIVLLFVALGLWVVLARDPRARRARTHLFLAYTLGVNIAVAAAQTDAWPFSPYRMMAVDATTHDNPRSMVAFKGVDGEGTEWDLDPLSWSPLYPQAVMGWFEVVYPRTAETPRKDALRFLHERAEHARQALSAGRPFGNRLVLGAMGAPDNFVYGASPVSPRLFVALRVYRVTWRPNELLRDPGTAVWRLIDQHPPP